MNAATYILIIINLLTLGLVGYLFFLISKKGPTTQTTNQTQLGRMQESLTQVETLENQFKQLLEELISKNKEMIQSTSESLVKYYQDTVTTMTLNYNQNTEKLMQLLDDELKKKVAELDKATIGQIQQSREEVNQQVKKDLDELNKKLDSYAKERFSQLDEKIYEIVSETAKNSVGKVINLVDHQELVMTALDQAKKDKFFN